MLISIYPMPGGEPREMRAEASIASSGPFDSPPVISGRLISAPGDSELAEIVASEVLFEGETYIFDSLQRDGSFQLHKAW
jgi:hypothetical protein